MHNNVVYRRVLPADFPQLLSLQDRNYIANLTDAETAEGFLSIQYSEQQFREIDRDLGIAVAVRGSSLLGYLCATTFAYGSQFPLLSEVIGRVRGRMLGVTPLDESHAFLYGPVCIDRAARGSGVLEGLFAAMKTIAGSRYAACVLFISGQNPRSVNAHLRKLNMQELARFSFGGKDYYLAGRELEGPHRERKP